MEQKLGRGSGWRRSPLESGGSQTGATSLLPSSTSGGVEHMNQMQGSISWWYIVVAVVISVGFLTPIDTPQPTLFANTDKTEQIWRFNIEIFFINCIYFVSLFSIKLNNVYVAFRFVLTYLTAFISFIARIFSYIRNIMYH